MGGEIDDSSLIGETLSMLATPPSGRISDPPESFALVYNGDGPSHIFVSINYDN